MNMNAGLLIVAGIFAILHALGVPFIVDMGREMVYSYQHMTFEEVKAVACLAFFITYLQTCGSK